ncbi:MAG: hypothetical protein ACRBDX_05050 [Gammaproteobacteria bacterium]
MSNIENIKIKGLDNNRRPSLKNKKYIDIIYELTQQAPRDWCADFNMLFSKHTLNAKISPENGLYIETWVRDVAHIQKELDQIKEIIKTCNTSYIEQKRAEAAAFLGAENLKGGDSQSEALDKILDLLNFD